MRYMLLVYSDPDFYQRMSQDEQGAVFQEYIAIAAEMDARGVRESGEPLQSISTATTVRVRNGRTITTDGPFAETREHLVGYYLLRCDNLDQALEYAATIPHSRYGAVEIRPIGGIGPPAAM